MPNTVDDGRAVEFAVLLVDNEIPAAVANAVEIMVEGPVCWTWDEIVGGSEFVLS